MNVKTLGIGMVAVVFWTACTLGQEALSGSATACTPVPVPYAWLDANAGVILEATGGDYEAAAIATAANGSSVWECYVEGLDPTDAGAVFRMKPISLKDGQVHVAFAPVLTERVYWVEGTRTLEGEWMVIDADEGDLPATGMRFFRTRASLPEGDGDATYSQNAVGFVSQELSAWKKCLVTIPFVNMESEDGLFKFGETAAAEDLPNGSVVCFWDEEHQTWESCTKDKRGRWSSNAAEHQLRPGEGFILQPAEDFTVVISGEVPSEESVSCGFSGGNKWSVMANPYPTEVKFGDTELAGELTAGSVVNFWDAGRQKWDGGMKSSFGWDPAEANHVLAPGEAFCIRSMEEGTWEVQKPYAWP